MSELGAKERAEAVRRMFARIAGRYDLVNRIMTGGQDVRWRKEVIRRAGLEAGSRLLDIGAGTGDLIREASRQHPEAWAVGADFTLEMMRAGMGRARCNFAAADALSLPFRSESFDAVVSGFLVRNVVDLKRALEEQYRVLKPGGRVVVLDTTRPGRNLFSPLIRIHMRHVIPLLGKVITGDGAAYRYLPESSENFITAEELAGVMASAGFRHIGYRRMMFGTTAIHWGER